MDRLLEPGQMLSAVIVKCRRCSLCDAVKNCGVPGLNKLELESKGWKLTIQGWMCKRCV